jgi:hypothetical protein
MMAILKGARQKWGALIPQLPDTGGFQNPHTQIIISAALFLTLYRELEVHGQTMDEVGTLILEAVVKMYQSWPGFMMRLLRNIQRKISGDRTARQLASISQQRHYPNDFVCVFVEGDGKNFDYGFDYLECGIWKFFHAQKAEEFVPYMCRLDFAYADAMGQRLMRTGTIASGNVKCDFRYKEL